MRSFRPSSVVQAFAEQIAKAMPPRQLGGFRGSKVRLVPISWKNRRVVDAATAHDAHRRIDAYPEQYPNRMGRQQKRWLTRRGLL